MADKEKNSKNYWYVIFTISIFYILFLNFYVKPIISSTNGKFVTPKETTYHNGIETDYVLIKDEITFNYNSVSTPMGYDEGTRLGFGVIKAAKAESGEYAVLSKKLAEIDDRLSIYTHKINDVDKELRRSILSENFIAASDIVGSFSYNNDGFDGKMDVESLEQEKGIILEKINKSAGEVIWNPPGIISYSLDGFEDLKTNDIYTMTSDDFKSIINRPIVRTNSNDFKIVDNFNAIATFLFPNNEMLRSHDGKYISYSIDGLNTIGTGKLIIPADYSTNGVAGVQINNHIEDIYKNRKGKIYVIFDEMNALIVPTKSLIKINGEMGVLARDVNGVIQFRPVDLLKREGKDTYISAGDENGYIVRSEENVKTLRYFEDVITTPREDIIGDIYLRDVFNWLEVSMSIKDNLDEIHRIIDVAAKKSGRTKEDITLCAVTKTVDKDRILEAIELGINNIGENKVQELRDKLEYIPKDVNIHLIGQLQTNKVKYIINHVSLIHSLDRLSLLKELDKEAKKNDRLVNALIQINLTDDSNRGGVQIGDLPEFVKMVKNYKNVRVNGLMCVAHNTDDVNVIRDDFKKMKLEFDRLMLYNIDNVSADILSMGMSSDYEIAIEEGATMVRIGTKIFGKR